MNFGTVDIAHCEGCLLAHSQTTVHGRIGKGTRITADIALQLAEHGLSTVVVAQLENGDIHEDAAAHAVAAQLSGNSVSLSRARTGRVNLMASVEGLCHFDAKAIIEANCIDEGITIATLPENHWVARGRMVATVKIIPYAVSNASLQAVLTVLAKRTLSVTKPVPHRVELLQTRLSSIKESVLDKTYRITNERLVSRGASLTYESRCHHDAAPLVTLIGESLQRLPDWILIVGASAISDRADVIPQAIVMAGGTIDRYGLPVDPGNLLLLAHIGTTRIVGLPGCARSKRYNGLDMIFDRMACELPITDSWLNGLSVGGLLAEIADRPAPRIIRSDQYKIGALVLAAGSSRRAGKTNKLLVPYGKHTLVSHVAKVVCNSNACRVIAVTGFEPTLVEDALSSLTIECHYNGAHNSGMASSVVAGVSQLSDTDGVLICLGDMPHITTHIINQLIEAYKNNPDKSIFVPVNNKQRGNPVLFSNVFFDTLLSLEGDVGARKLVQQYPDEVYELEVAGSGLFVDYDTEEELSALNV